MLLAFCASCASSVQAIQSELSRDAAKVLPAAASQKRTKVYVANSDATYVTVYSKQSTGLLNKLNRKLGRPYTLLIDGTGTLYVSNSHGVNEYSSDSKNPVRVLKGTSYPAIALDSEGNLYAGSGHVIHVYAPGATSPTRDITANVSEPTAMLFDSSGNLYVANDSPPVSIEVYAPGQDTPFRSINSGISDPVAIALDHEQNLYVANNFATISVFAAGTSTLIRYLQVTCPFTPNSLAFDSADQLYAADEKSPNGQIDVFKPLSSSVSRTILMVLTVQ
jgi:6-phosphogluconolactonase (cycloisomerase 2 family)